MNPQTFIEIAEIAIGIAKDITNKTQGVDTDIETSIREIAQKTLYAYQQHTGEPMDLSLIQIEAPIQ